MPPKAEVDPGLRTAEFGLAGAVVVGTFLVPSANALAHDTSSAEVEKQALAAFGSNAITRTIESFSSPRSQASTLELGRAASSSAATEATATEASVSYIPEEDQPSGDTPPPPNVEETPPSETTPPEEATPSTAAELKKACVDAGLEGPETVYSHMVRPGVSSSGPSQSVEGRFLYKIMPEFCKDKYKRFASFLVQIKDKVGNKWRNMTSTGKKRWDSLYIDEAGEFLDAKENGEAVGDLSLYPSGHGGIMDNPNSYFFNKTCRKVRSFIRTKIVKNKPRKVHDFPGQPGLYRWVYPKVKEEVKKVAVEVLGKCAKRVKR